MLRTSLLRAGAARSATERPTRRSKRTTRAPPTRMVRSRCRPRPQKCSQKGGWLTAWKRLQRPYLASRRALRAFKRNAATGFKKQTKTGSLGRGGLVLDRLRSRSWCNTVLRGPYVSQLLRCGSPAAQIGRPAATVTCSLKAVLSQASNRSLEIAWDINFSSR